MAVRETADNPAIDQFDECHQTTVVIVLMMRHVAIQIAGSVAEVLADVTVRKIKFLTSLPHDAIHHQLLPSCSGLRVAADMLMKPVVAHWAAGLDVVCLRQESVPRVPCS